MINYQDKIRELTYSRKYEESNNYICEYLSILKPENVDSLWFCNYYLSFNNLKLKNYKDAWEYNIAALNLALKNSNQYIHTLWLKATIHKYLNENKEAIDCYKICAEYYKENNCIKFYLNNLFDMAKIEKNTVSMERILKTYIRATNSDEELNKYNAETFLDNFIIEMYEELIALYIQNNNKEKAIRLLKTIANKELKKELSSKFLIA